MAGFVLMIIYYSLPKGHPASGRTINNHPFVLDLAETLYANRWSASEVHHIGFLKVHKAGSTTIQNVLFRFGLKRNLTFVLPDYSNFFLLHPTLPVKPGGHYDILAVHSVYRKEDFDSVLPLDHVNIGIVREPLNRMISAAYYYRDTFNKSHLLSVPRSNFIQELINHPEKYEKEFFSETRNSMGRDFGFDSTIKDTHIDAILKRLVFLDREFKLVLITERFEESLVLMKRYFNWKLSDILFIPRNAYKHEAEKLTEEQRAKHRKTCFLDYAIYDFFWKVFDYKVENEEGDFKDEVRQFKNILDQTTSFCGRSKSPNNNLQIFATRWNDDFGISHSDCALMEMDEMKFIENLRARHIQMNS